MSVFDMDSMESIDSDDMSDDGKDKDDEAPVEEADDVDVELVDNGEDDNEEMVNKRSTFIDEIDARMSHF